MMHHPPMDVSAECCGQPDVRRAQLELYASHEHWRATPMTFSQGRTLGLLHVRPADVLQRLDAARRVRRVLVHGRAGDLPRLARIIRTAGWAVDERLVLLSARAADLIPADDVQPRTWCLNRLGAESSQRVISAVQDFQERCGITPLPGWFLRGIGGEACTCVLLSTSEDVLATGTVQAIRGRGRLVRAAMGLAIAVAPEHRGIGLGRTLNSTLLTMATREFAAETLLEIVEDPDGPSARMNRSCGLAPDRSDGFLYAQRRGDVE